MAAFHAWAQRVGFTEYYSGRDGSLEITGPHDGADPEVGMPGDWVVKNPSGTFTFYGADFFASHYERV